MLVLENCAQQLAAALLPPGQHYQRCTLVLLTELDRWATDSNLPGVTSVLLPSGAGHKLPAVVGLTQFGE